MIKTDEKTHRKPKAPMLTNLNSLATDFTNQIKRRTNNLLSYTFNNSSSDIKSNKNTRTNSIYPTIYPIIYTHHHQPSERNRTSTIKKSKPTNLNLASNDFKNRNSTVSSPINQPQATNSNDHFHENENKNESIIEMMETSKRNEKDDNELEKISAGRSINDDFDENLNNFEYKNVDDQYLYYDRNQIDIEPSFKPSFEIKQSSVTEKFDQTIDHDDVNDQTNDKNVRSGLESNLKSNLGFVSTKHPNDEKQTKQRTSLDEFNVMYEDFKKIKKLGYDYNFYDE